MCFVALGLALLLQVGSSREDDTAAALLNVGVRQYRDGDFEAAVFTLDLAVRKLAEQPGRTADLARAYVYLGAAYVGFDHEKAATGKFREALTLDPSLRLTPAEFSQRVIKLFEGQRLRQTAEKKTKGTKIALILGGSAAAAAVGISAATSKGGALPNRPPTVTIGVSPEGLPLASVTVLTFRASASDPDGDPLTYRWTFGDGASATGPEVTHRFDREGSFVVEVSAEDGRGGSAQAQFGASPRTLNGLWWESFSGVSREDQSIECTQTGATFDCRLVLCRASCIEFEVGRIQRVYGRLEHPRLVFANVEYVRLYRDARDGPCNGLVNTALNFMSCGGTPTGFQLARK